MPIAQVPYKPRPLQKLAAAEIRRHRFSVLVCHRRFGKTVLAVNLLQQGALMCQKSRPRFAYIGPTYRQGKTAAWDYMQYFARPIPDQVANQGELRLDYPNGGQVRIFGADNPDSLRGIYLDGVVFDEYGLMPPNVFTEVVRPALSDRQGWALFIGTPNGKNQFYDLVNGTQGWPGARADPAWFSGEYKASQTGLLSPAELASARAVMTEDEYQQEYECSFEASVKGAIYAKELDTLRQEGRMTAVAYDATLPVDTDWDLGIGDAMAVWFSQTAKGSGQVRLIDYYEASGEGLPHFVKMLADKGYVYGRHWAPHDIAVRELGSGKSRLEVARGLGLRFEMTPRVTGSVGGEVEEGIHAARLFFPRCWFDATRCRIGLEALGQYRRDYNSRLHTFKATPVHDEASHAADAFRGLAVRHQPPKEATTSHYNLSRSAGGSGWMSA